MLGGVAEFAVRFALIITKHLIYLKIYKGCVVAFLCHFLLEATLSSRKKKSDMNDTQSMSNQHKWNYYSYLRGWIWYKELVHWKCIGGLQTRKKQQETVTENAGSSLHPTSCRNHRKSLAYQKLEVGNSDGPRPWRSGHCLVLATWSLVRKCGKNLKTRANGPGKELLPGDAVSKIYSREFMSLFSPLAFPFLSGTLYSPSREKVK